MLFLEKWREFLGGGNDIWVFLKKGNHPHRAGPGRWASGQMGLRADGRRTSGIIRSRKQKEGRKLRFATFIFHWKLFPSFATVRIKYQSKNNNINL